MMKLPSYLTQAERNHLRKLCAFKRLVYTFCAIACFLSATIHGYKAWLNGPQFDPVNAPICTALVIISFLFWVLVIHVRDDQEAKL